MRTLISGGTVVNADGSAQADVLVDRPRHQLSDPVLLASPGFPNVRRAEGLAITLSVDRDVYPILMSALEQRHYATRVTLEELIWS